MIRIACCLIVLGFTLGRADAEQRYALVIGSNPGWSQDRPLSYADHDAERIRDVLVALGGIAADHVQLLHDPDAADVRRAVSRLADLLRPITEDTVVFVYYSGHADDRYLHLRGEPPLSHHELQDVLRGLPATVKIGVIDACKSGAVTQKGGAAAREFDVDVVTPKLSGLVLLTSSGADELSQESRALRGSVFTHHLVSGLRGAADANGDQAITLAEAYSYAYDLTRADTTSSGAPQRPRFRYELSGQGDLVLTRLATTQQAQLRVPPGPPQRYVILDSHGWRLIAEARAEPTREVVVTLAPGRYRVEHVLDDRLDVGRVDLAPGSRVDLDRVRYRGEPLAIGNGKGGRDPQTLSRAERHVWERERAFSVLANGNANAAINMFDRLVIEDRGDAVAWRGRARALIRMAELYKQLNDRDRERRALVEAQKSDPSLANDPAFQRWYLPFTARDRADQAARDERARSKAAREADPRGGRRFGLGFDFLSARGVVAVEATAVVRRKFFPSVAIDPLTVSLDSGLVYVPLRARWSPYLAIGGHVSLEQLGLRDDTAARVNEDASDLEDVFDLHARLEAGFQFVGTSGFTMDLGFSVIAYARRKGGAGATGWPIFHFGWLF